MNYFALPKDGIIMPLDLYVLCQSDHGHAEPRRIFAVPTTRNMKGTAIAVGFRKRRESALQALIRSVPQHPAFSASCGIHFDSDVPHQHHAQANFLCLCLFTLQTHGSSFWPLSRTYG
jgi:hypothetical protein